MNVQIILILGLSLLLNACVPIRVIPKYNPDLYNGYKVVQAYQRKDSIGYTDVEQRKKDVFACGVRNYFDGNLDLNQHYPEMTSEERTSRRISIDSCMKNKGYIIYSPEKCTINGKSTGFCN